MALSRSDRDRLLDQICTVTLRLTSPHSTEVELELRDELHRLVAMLWCDSRPKDRSGDAGDG